MSRNEAEEVLGWLQEQLGNFELRLNERKTSIVELPQTIDEAWLPQIRDLPFDKTTSRRERHSLIRFFDESYRLAHSHRQEHVLRYALGKASAYRFEDDNLDIFQQLVLAAAIAEPGCLAGCISILQNLRITGRNVLLTDLEEAFNAIIDLHGGLGHHSEVAWAIFGCILFGLHIHEHARRRIERCDDDFVALLALDAASKGLVNGTLDSSLWSAYVNPDELYGRHWLFAYEALRHRGPLADPFFQFLASNNVSFYLPVNPSAHINLSTPGQQAPTVIPGGGPSYSY